MKNITLFLFSALLLLSCSPGKNELPQESELVSYNLSLGGELSMSESPLRESASKTAANATKNDLFGIQVYDVYGNPYARVVGDDISRITLEFEQGQEYELQATYIKNAKNLLLQHAADEYTYGDPFLTANFGAVRLNKVYYESDDHLKQLGSNLISGNWDITHQRYTPADRYYNSLAFLASGEDLEIDMNLKRVSIGLSLELDLGEEAEMMDWVLFTPNESISYEIALTNGKGALEIPYLTLPGDENLRAMDKIIQEGHRETFLFQLGTEENKAALFSGDISVQRNTMFKVRITHEALTEKGNVKGEI